MPPRADAKRLLLVPSEATPAEVLYERVAPVVNRMVWLYLATDRERDDVAQDIFIAILRGAGSVRDPGQLEGWAARVAFHTICNVFRRRKVVRWLSLEALTGYEPPGEPADHEGRELVARAQKVLEHLPLSERMPFTLQLLSNASIEEIARLSECSVRTVGRRLTAARARFLRLVKHDPALAARLARGGPPADEEETPDG
jgi:RNA polymerase sigma-70 factor (ECF subfamily)